MVFITAVENFVLFNTLLALGSFALACAARREARRGSWQPHMLTRLYAAAIVIPPVIAMWIVAASLLPELWLSDVTFDAAHTAPLHELHLLGYLTAMLEPALSLAMFTFIVTAIVFAAWSSARGYARIGRVIKCLEMNAAPPPPEQLALVRELTARRKLAVGLVMSNYPLSFVWGFWRTKLVLSSGLLHALTPEELTGVLEHEAAHSARRDNLVKLALTFCSYASIAFPLSRLMLGWRAMEVEMVCDEVAVAHTSSPLEIADAIVKLRRQSLTPVGFAPAAGSAASGFVPDDPQVLELRVNRLIAFTDVLPDPARAIILSQSCKGEAFLVAVVFAATMSAVFMFAPLIVHRAAESLIQLI